MCPSKMNSPSKNLSYFEETVFSFLMYFKEFVMEQLQRDCFVDVIDYKVYEKYTAYAWHWINWF